jgi:mannose-6-phosphate isomerase-like protein (cupin superfamily)
MTQSTQSTGFVPGKVTPLDIGSAVTEAYHNRSLASVNDHEVRMSVMTGGFGWHRHPDSDETFIGVDGELVIEFESGTIVLSPNEMLTVPKGVLHRTRPLNARSVNLTFERRDVQTVFVDPA